MFRLFLTIKIGNDFADHRSIVLISDKTARKNFDIVGEMYTKIQTKQSTFFIPLEGTTRSVYVLSGDVCLTNQ